MDGDRAFTAYCGLYCGDCIPSQARLFELLEELRGLASELHLDSYAEMIARKDAPFGDYPAFEGMLTLLMGLRCSSPCREGGGKPDCRIRECALERGFYGCWECPERAGCELLGPLRRFHGETIDGNLDAIAENGMDGWSHVRGRHYPWSPGRK